MNYKKLFVYCLVFATSFLLYNMPSYALTKTPSPKVTPPVTPSPTPHGPKLLNALDQQINDLKDRIASRVAQLKLVEKRGTVGIVTDITGTQITLRDLRNDIRLVDVDELTKFSSPSASGTFGISDITKGTKLGVLGLYNKQSRRILARFVDVMITPVILNGAIKSIDAPNYAIQVITPDQKQYVVDIETSTKTKLYTTENGLVKSGFVKMNENENIFLVGYADLKNSNRISASRIILFPDIPINPKIVIPQSALNPGDETIPSTGSGKKLTPIR